MNLIWLHPRDGEPYSRVHAFLSERIGRVEQGTTLAVCNGSALVAAVAYGGFRKDRGVIEMSAAADGPWITRPVLKEAFGYPFGQLGCQAVVLRAETSNAKVRKLAQALGFRRYEIPRLRGRDKPEAIFVLGDDEWRAGRFSQPFWSRSDHPA